MNPNPVHKGLLSLFVLFYAEGARAVVIEQLGNAVASALALKGGKVIRAPASATKQEVFLTRGADGKPAKFAIVQKGIYEPNCTHTWVVGINAKTAKVEQIRVVEMSCPHAFPCKESSFLEQYRGKGPADLKSLKGKVTTIAKATGSSNLTTDAVVKSIVEVQQLIKGNL